MGHVFARTASDLRRSRKAFDVGNTLSGPDRSAVPTTIVKTNNVQPIALSLLSARLRTVQAAEKSPASRSWATRQG